MKMKITLLVLLAATLLTGCVERELIITSEPSGVLVVVSDTMEVRTPATVKFKWYGDYDVIARMEGYETLKTHVQLTPPIYEIPPFDLLNAVMPGIRRDQRYLHIKMKKLEEPAEADLIHKADEMRQKTLEHVER